MGAQQQYKNRKRKACQHSRKKIFVSFYLLLFKFNQDKGFDYQFKSKEIIIIFLIQFTQLITNKFQKSMINSRSIKLLITNSSQPKEEVPLTSKNNQQILKQSTKQITPKFHRELSQSSIQIQLRSMFTIREQESFEYQSQCNSQCIVRKRNCESFIDNLSSIRAEKNKENFNLNNVEQVGNFDPSETDKKASSITMSTFNKHKLQQNTISNLSSWEQKMIREDVDEQIIQEQIVVLKESEKALKLDKMRMHNSGVTIKANEKVRKDYDIIYSCSQKQLIEIKGILEREGIRLVQKNNHDSIDGSKSNRKVKLKLVKPNGDLKKVQKDKSAQKLK